MKTSVLNFSNCKIKYGTWISELEDRVENITQSENQKEKTIKKQEDSLRKLWDNVKCNNIRIVGVPEEAERENGIEKVFEEIMIENFPNLEKEKVTQIQEAHRTPNKNNSNRPTLKHIIIKMSKIKDKERIIYLFVYLLNYLYCLFIYLLTYIV
uniref:L1 transposable element RRM domain-containing protein n=1 Tax=Myotis myotis TaxID=51298 RepID=A0A7J8AMX3_MYOMY|nr:hypothetical protein mMyoMyo1_008095 [Myotis myotis]